MPKKDPLDDVKQIEGYVLLAAIPFILYWVFSDSDDPKPEPSSSYATAIQSEIEMKPKTKATRGPQCRSAAASKWILDYTMAHEKPKQKKILKIMDEIPKLKQKIIRHCGDKSISAQLRMAANSKSKPKWIESEIDSIGVPLTVARAPSTTPSVPTTKNVSSYSKSCRTAAANKWLIDFSMAHGNPTLEQSMVFIRQVSQYTKLVKSLCGDSSINGEINRAANKAEKPKWIRKEIDALISQLP